MALAPWDSGKSMSYEFTRRFTANPTVPNTLEKVCHTDLIEGLQVSPSRRARPSFQTSAVGVPHKHTDVGRLYIMEANGISRYQRSQYMFGRCLPSLSLSSLIKSTMANCFRST
ncbi:hypothetical protein RIR_jg7267.t1 [Rhizophagus irregularis DAOM 181602=DAOM 197198]|uniref:Uncharacterized protein n=1 Tax=Rhizophagus irregularis (strain DAOM 181602 / DAOM 197198 / MUCL 43194) TaxID=747089 RepID=U9V0W2_RHIID|nr:hypothetical protein RIR_jg7267.t1 [Rhizophagus irregularis DAOM 181602=DAOM 197198]CAG8493517.1 17379_t:CDS:2 [Rhizophagus irregularis]